MNLGLRASIVATLLLSSGVRGQNVQTKPDPARTTVTLTFTIEDGGGTYLRSAAKDSIRVIAEKTELDLISVSPAAEKPLVMGLLLDRSGSRRDEFKGKNPSNELELVRDFFRATLRGSDRAFLGMLRDEGYWKTELTSDKGLLATWIDETSRYEPHGSTLLYDSIVQASGQLQEASKERRILVVITDGGDNVSGKSVRQMIDKILETRVSLFLVLVHNKQTQGRDHRMHWSVAKKVAESTGARVFDIKGPHELEKVFQQIKSEIDSHVLVTVGAVPPMNPRKLVRIKVAATDEKWKVRHPEGFFLPAAK